MHAKKPSIGLALCSELLRRAVSSLDAGRFLAIALVACSAWLCFQGLFQSRIPAFRDGYAFYYPQAVWLAEQAATGNWFPQWNPREGLGVSVSGQPSSGVYYPLRMVWWIPLLSIAQRYAVFIALHVLLAVQGMRWGAKQLGCSQSAQWLAGISYGLSCPVIFQHSNLIYLGSAAWIGFAMGATAPLWCSRPPDSIVKGWQSCVVFALACSLMFLAGDLHTAINAMLLVSLSVALQAVASLVAAIMSRWRSSYATMLESKPPGSHEAVAYEAVDGEGRERRGMCFGWRNSSLRCSLAWLMGAGLLFTMLTAVQWIPAAGWSWHSTRLASDQLPLTTASPELRRVLGETSIPSQRLFDFSLPPWYGLTWIWPTIGGDYQPENSRLFALLPAEGRMWVPSLYVGLIPFILACYAIGRAVRANGSDAVLPRWLLGLLAFAGLAALGSYSPVWLYREFLLWLGLDDWADALPPDSTASLYWILTAWVPGYSLFRYPAKWSVWMAAALSLLAAVGWDASPTRLRWGKSRWLVVVWWLSLLGTLVAATAWWWSGQGGGAEIDRFLAQIANDRLLGPPTLGSIAKRSLWGFLTPTLLLAPLFLREVGKRWIPCVTLLEMSWVASSWLVFAAPPQALPSAYPVLPPTVSSASLVWCPAELSGSGAGGASWLGKMGLLTEPRYLNSPQSIEPRVMAALRQWLRRHDQLGSDDDAMEVVLRELGGTHRLVRTPQGSLAWRTIENPRPLCELQLDQEQERDWSGQVLNARWLTSDRLEVWVRTQQPATLLVRQFNDGGWRLKIPAPPDASGRSVSTRLSPGTLFLEVPVLAGEHRLVLYRGWF
jgi:hypothetical protein